MIIPILGIICAVGMPIVLAIIISYMTIKSKHEEKMAMIEKGVILEEAAKPERKPNRYNTLRNGIFMIGLSIGVIVGLFVSPSFSIKDEWSYLLIPSITILSGGISFVVYFFLSHALIKAEQKEDEKKNNFEA